MSMTNMEDEYERELFGSYKGMVVIASEDASEIGAFNPNPYNYCPLWRQSAFQRVPVTKLTTLVTAPITQGDTQC